MAQKQVILGICQHKCPCGLTFLKNGVVLKTPRAQGAAMMRLISRLVMQEWEEFCVLRPLSEAAIRYPNECLRLWA